MNLYFNKIIIDNFLSIGHAEFDLNKRGFVFVRGVNRNYNDNAKSNGSGKSSLFDAISWALTGRTIRGITSVSNIYSNSDTSVKLYFISNGNSYEITRCRTKIKQMSTLGIKMNGEDISGKGVKASEKILNELLPDITYELLSAVVIMGQGLPQRFTNNTPSGRKSILEDLFQTNHMLEDLKNRASLRKNELLKSTEESKFNLVRLKTLKEENVKKFEDNKLKLQELLNSNDADSKLIAVEHKLKDITNDLDTVGINIKNNEEIKEQVTESLLQLSKIKSNKITDSCTDIEKNIQIVKDAIQEISYERDSVNNEILRIKSIKDVCPTCGQKLIGVVKPDVTELENSFEEMDGKLSELKKNLNEKNELLNSIKEDIEKEFLEEEIKIKNEILKITNSIQSMKLNQTSLLAEKENCVKSQSYYKNIIDSRENDIKSCRELEKNISDESAILEEKMLYNTNVESELEERIGIVDKFLFKLSREFRGILLNDIIDLINTNLSQYSSMIFNSDKVYICLEDSNMNIFLREKQYECLSGGEKQKVDILIQFAIRKVLSDYLGFSSNIIVLDEIFDNLDTTGCNALLYFLSNSIYDVESMFIISHHTDIQIPYDSEIVIEKDDTGVSYIKNDV